jgi:hypothetical protein
VDPHLQDTPFRFQVLCLIGFAARLRAGYYGDGKAIRGDTVAKNVSSVGQMIQSRRDGEAVAPVGADIECDEEGRWPNVEKLPVEADVPEYLIKQALIKAQGLHRGRAGCGGLDFDCFLLICSAWENIHSRELATAPNRDNSSSSRT